MSKEYKILPAPDIAKAIGIILVVFGHVLRGLVNANIIKNTPFWEEVDKLIYLFHMPLFFFISGLFFKTTFNRYGYREVVLRNIFALLIPLLVWSYLQFSIQYLASGSTNIKKSLGDVISAPFPPKEQFWFLWTLFQITFILSFAMKFKTNGAIFKLIFISTLFLNIFGFGEIGSKNIGNSLIRNIPYFIIGLVGGVNFLNNYRIKSVFTALIFAISLFIASFFNYNISDPYSEVVRLVTSIICLLSIYKFSLNLSTISPQSKYINYYNILIFIGMNSMIIYLAHVIFQAGYRSILIKLNIYNISAHLIGGTIAGVVVPLILVPIGVNLIKFNPRIFSSIVPVRIHRG